MYSTVLRSHSTVVCLVYFLFCTVLYSTGVQDLSCDSQYSVENSTNWHGCVSRAHQERGHMHDVPHLYFYYSTRGRMCTYYSSR
jgi:hypothetical protein